MMSLDLVEVSQCVLPGNNRNEVELQFPESDAIEANNDQLVSIRFYIPPDPDVDPSDKTAKSSAELLQQRIMQMANIRKTTGDVIGMRKNRVRYKVTLLNKDIDHSSRNVRILNVFFSHLFTLILRSISPSIRSRV